ncbi:MULTISPECIES: dCTP deaminase domain-containing protein [Acinetobacter]|uniref:dCTP deaminase n=1 Tax=Acinetobacter TaxID=469 RepID=UPI00141A8C0D|nr:MULTISPECIES: deoxycytidine deaminase [Acinetobacter]MCS4298406.1 deoxycytidine triphosphate deaminase [Acinetobacter guillouiae]MCW2252010.1 deoxycytidine triphosphate deaminase [Acinetobacter sp. BIGb0204]NII38663.1 deoxycytidine triphosphate deaminase [Acinetobacter sp. BIGb0196]
MLIIDQNLKSLVKQHQICEDFSLIDHNCLHLKLHYKHYKLKRGGANQIIKYGYPIEKIKDFYIKKESECAFIQLKPMEQVLACSFDKYNLPNNVFGLVQTKGSLARLFVQITCNDGQVDPGFKGHITFEIVNLSPMTIEIPVYSKVGQLYLFSTSMKSTNPYNGRYAAKSLEGPTLPIFNGQN